MAQQPPANSLISLDTLQEAYVRLDGELRYAFINFAAENILGVPSADLIGKTPWEIGPVSAGTSLERKLRRARDERTAVSFNACLEPSHRWHRIAAMPDPAGGLVLQISGLLSGQRNTDAYFNSMREAVAVHRLTFSGTNPANYILLDANPIFEEMVGLERLDLVNRFASDVFHTRDAPFLYEFASAVQSRAATRFEAWFPPIGRHFSISVLPLGDDLFASLFFDITEQIKTAERLRKAEEKFARAFRSNPAAIAIADLTTEIYLEVNDAFEQISGYRRDEIIGKTWDQIRLWPDRSNRDEALALLRREKRLRNWEFRFAKKDGGTGSGLLSAELIELDGHAVGITATMDITELLRLQGQLRQSQKLESIGRLAGGVAHDFNNLLTVINGYADLVAGRLDPQDSLRSNVDEIRKAGQRAAGLTRQLLTLSRTQIIQPKPLDLNGIVTESEQMLRGLIGEDIRLFTKLDPLLGNIMADPEQLYSVVMNLVVNARDAMPDGGNLFIKTANVEMNEEDPAIPPDAKPGAYVLMTVTDTGSGIDEDTRQHIFEPFFTTKERGKGTGLGLSTVYGVVRQNGGWIEVSGELGVGTSFKIYLPRVDALSVEVRPESPPAAGLQGDETVLIVEDQEAVLRYAKASLETYGYHVLDAANGNAAMAVAQNYSGQIDLILTDVVLPGMNGKVLAEQLTAARPDLKVLFMSGYPADVIAHRGVLDSGVSYIPKPFSPDGLASKIREVLAGTSSSAS